MSGALSGLEHLLRESRGALYDEKLGYPGEYQIHPLAYTQHVYVGGTGRWRQFADMRTAAETNARFGTSSSTARTASPKPNLRYATITGPRLGLPALPQRGRHRKDAACGFTM